MRASSCGTPHQARACTVEWILHGYRPPGELLSLLRIKAIQPACIALVKLLLLGYQLAELVRGWPPWGRPVHLNRSPYRGWF